MFVLGQQPKWIVYDKILKTSEDYVTNITPMADDEIESCISRGLISIDREYLESKVVCQICKIPVGKYVFWKFVGPMHSGRRDMEELIKVACDETQVVIDADKQKGEISLYARKKYKAVADRLIRRALDHISAVLRNEGKELSLGCDRSGVRAVLGSGGNVLDILMPYEYRSLNIRQRLFSVFELSVDGLKLALSRSGPIDQLWQFKGKKQSNFWGRVTFLNQKDAVTAEKDINTAKKEGVEHH